MTVETWFRIGLGSIRFGFGFIDAGPACRRLRLPWRRPEGVGVCARICIRAQCIYMCARTCVCACTCARARVCVRVYVRVRARAHTNMQARARVSVWVVSGVDVDFRVLLGPPAPGPPGPRGGDLDLLLGFGADFLPATSGATSGAAALVPGAGFLSLGPRGGDFDVTRGFGGLVPGAGFLSLGPRGGDFAEVAPVASEQ